jgi:hypothetical protein
MSIKQALGNIYGGRRTYLQQILFELALAEMGLRVPGDLVVDHRKGVVYVNQEPVQLLYPYSWFRKINKIGRSERFKYSFVGAITASGGRKAMLAPFTGEGNLILATTHQRGRAKGTFDKRYYSILRATQFALCPNHIDWPGPPAYAWTYRFVEAALTGAIPICFREAPLGEHFITGFTFYWADEPLTHVYRADIAERNLQLALERHVSPTTLMASWAL